MLFFTPLPATARCRRCRLSGRGMPESKPSGYGPARRSHRHPLTGTCFARGEVSRRNLLQVLASTTLLPFSRSFRLGGTFTVPSLRSIFPLHPLAVHRSFTLLRSIATPATLHLVPFSFSLSPHRGLHRFLTLRVLCRLCRESITECVDAVRVSSPLERTLTDPGEVCEN
jgi:hypothetical protein